MAVRFDADGEDYTRTANLPSQTVFTWCFWVVLDVDRNTWSTALSQHIDTSNYTHIQTDEDGVTLTLFDSASTQIAIQALTVGTWYFVAVSRNGTGANTNIYRAAAGAASLSAQTGQTLNSNFTPTVLQVGESAFGSEWLNGRIAAVKIWSGVALTQAEIEAEWRQQCPVRFANLNSFYPFLAGGAVAAAQADYSGIGGNLSGGTNSATADGPPVPWRLSKRRMYSAVAAGGGAITSAARIAFGSKQSAQAAVARVSSAQIAMKVAARAASAVNRIAGARMSFLSFVRALAPSGQTSAARISFQSLLRASPLLSLVGAARLLARTGMSARFFQDTTPIAAKVSGTTVTEAKVADAPVTGAKVADTSVTRAKITTSLGG